MSLIKELKRRNVIRVAIAYAIVAWLLIEISATTFPMLRLPEWTATFVTVLLMIGFPLALIFAWAFELTPEGIKLEKHVDRSKSVTHVTGRKLNFLIIAVLVLALGYFAFDKFVLDPTRDAELVQTTTKAVTGKAAEAEAIDKSIAVLPFANRSAREEDSFFVDGVHDDILTQLARIGSLTVISRTSVEKFRGTSQSMREIGAALGVKNILEGAVQRAGDRVRINVQLIDVSTDDHLWAETYDRELTTANIFAIQSEISTAIAAALKAALSPEEKTRLDTAQTENMAALEAYFLGRQAMAKRTSASLAEAERQYTRALELDPNYALAYVGLANTYYFQTIYSGRQAQEQKALAEPLLKKALEIDNLSGQAYIAMAHVVDNPEAREIFFKKGIDLAPGYALGHHLYGDFLSNQGRPREALIPVEQAARLDPLSSIVKANKGEVLAMLGRFDEARQEYESIIHTDPGFARAYSNLGNLDRYVYGRLDNAIVLARQAVALDPGNPQYRSMLANLWADLGDAAEADRSIERLRAIDTSENQVKYAEAWLKLLRGGVANAAADAEALFAEFPRDSFVLWILGLNDLRLDRAEVAVERYRAAYPALTDNLDPVIDLGNYWQAIDVAYLLQKTGDQARANYLLDRSMTFIQTIPRLGSTGHWYTDVRIFALQGKNDRALVALREAVDEGWRSTWQYFLKQEPALEELHGEAEYQAIVAELEADMSAQLERVREMAASGELAPVPE